MTATPTMNRHQRRRLSKLAPEFTPQAAQAVTERVAKSDEWRVAPGTSEMEWLLGALVQSGASLSDAVRQAEKVEGTRPGLYRNHLHLLLDRGKSWTSEDVTLVADLPGKGPRFPSVDSHCYENAFRAAKHYGLKYAEGWVRLDIVPEGYDEAQRMVVHHGWAYDPSTGGIVDTWPEPATEYLGLVYEWEQVQDSIAATGYFGMVVNDHLRGFDLLAKGLLGTDYTGKEG